MRLVARIATRAQLLERHHQLDRVEQPCDACELGRRQTPGKAHELVARDVHVDEHPGEPLVRQGHRLPGDVEIDAVRDQEAVDHVELRGGAPVETRHDPVLDDELRSGIGGPAGRDEAELRPRLDEQLAPELRAPRGP